MFKIIQMTTSIFYFGKRVTQHTKQIMSGLEGNRQIYFALRDSGLPPQEFLLTEAQPRSIEIFGEAILNLKGQIDSLLPEGPFIICFIIPYVTHRKNDYTYFN